MHGGVCYNFLGGGVFGGGCGRGRNSWKGEGLGRIGKGGGDGKMEMGILSIGLLGKGGVLRIIQVVR